MLLQRIQHAVRHRTPRLCALCELPLTAWDHHWCASCLTYFQSTPRCTRCGLSMPFPTDRCGTCLQSPPLWNALYCLGDYAYPLAPMIHQIKYGRQFWLIPPLAALLAQVIPSPAPLLLPVPLHWRRYLYRGFNQSDLLAHHLSQALSVSYQTKLLQRIRSTPPQEGLHKNEREQNLRKAFMLRNRPSAKHIAIVDDVVTTGSTISQLCQLLLEVGVEYIDIYCLCRTPEYHNQ
ncbi:phosphoribosyltransferase family protein [Vibrio spartinae]|uniref:DNA utilization protein GntX n=1 Tax=Vibrio spartinae TaxID=1918945 RepID=A0ABX6R2N1_9VIBR|nr:DNA utilization protein GntX [Vibrio spartinae]